MNVINPIENKMLARIRQRGAGWVFSPSDFLHFGSRHAVDKALSRMATKGSIRRLARGLYDYPRQHPVMGMLAPSPDSVAKALADKNATRLQPSGAYAANLLGLTEQVPAKIVFLTDGISKRVKIGRQEITLKRTSPRNMATAGRLSGIVIQALRYIGKSHMNDEMLRSLMQKIKHEDRKQLLKDVVYAPAWIANIMRQLARKT